MGIMKKTPRFLKKDIYKNKRQRYTILTVIKHCRNLIWKGKEYSMAVGFALVFSGLRHEKNISQRKAAADLKISQALLSHYENGVREPRLDFVVRACEYYGVSADYLLGRTSAKDNPMTVGERKNSEEAPFGQITGNENLHSLVNSIVVAFNLLSNWACPKAVEELADCIGILVYKVLRNFHVTRDEEAKAVFAMPQSKFDALCDAALKKAEAELAGEIFSAERAETGKKIPAGQLKKEFPQIYKSIAELMERMEFKIFDTTAQKG